MLNRHSCTGWCYNRLFKSRPVTLVFYRGEKMIGTTRCEEYRRDLVELNLHPTGLCGFNVTFEPISSNYSHSPLVVKARGYPRPLKVIPAERIMQSVDSVAKTLFFMHIPKSAGTSFNNFMRPYFAFAQTAVHIEGAELAQQKEMALRHYVSGHLSLAQINDIYDDLDGINLYTILREPYQHLHSHFTWVKGIANPKVASLFKDHTKRVQKLSLKISRVNLKDYGELEKLVAALAGFELEFFDNLQTRYFLDYRVEKVAQSDLERAMENKIQFKSIGITEAFSSYTRQVCDNYDLHFAEQKISYNLSTVKPLFDLSDQTTRKILEPLVKFDLLLYQSIKQTWRDK